MGKGCHLQPHRTQLRTATLLSQLPGSHHNLGEVVSSEVYHPQLFYLLLQPVTEQVNLLRENKAYQRVAASSTLLLHMHSHKHRPCSSLTPGLLTELRASGLG